MANRVKLTAAQVSAIECRMDGEEQVDGLVLDGSHLVVEDQEATMRALMDASNAEADAAEEASQQHDATFARRAARSLDAVWGKVARLGGAR